MTIQEVEQTSAAWDQLAEGFNTFVTPRNMALAEESLHRVGLRPGMRVLDVAAGSGALSIPAAHLGARVLATDIAPLMIEQLMARARKEGLANLEARVMDGQALDLEDDTFDISASQFGVMLFPDLPRGLSEMARVTRPGGKVLVIAFGPPEQIEFLNVFIGAIKEAVPGFMGLPMDPPPLPFQVSNPEVLRQRMAETGLQDVRIERATHNLEGETGDEFYDAITHSNPIGAMLVADLSKEQKATVRQALDDIVKERSGGSGPPVLSNPVNIGIGTKPLR